MPENENQKSGLGKSLLVLIIISIILIAGWQYGIPYLDDSIKLPSDYITDYFTEGEPIFFRPFIRNELTGFVYSQGNTPDFCLNGNGEMFYTFGVETNAPPSFTKEFRISVKYEFRNVSSSAWEIVSSNVFNMGTWDLASKNTFDFFTPIYPVATQHWIVSLYDTDGNIYPLKFRDGSLLPASPVNIPTLIALNSDSAVGDAPYYTAYTFTEP